MKADTSYSHIEVCPSTGDQVLRDERFDNGGVCPRCGHVDYLISHHDVIVGRWVRPNLYERIFKRMKPEFLRKDDEDKIWERLSECDT